jgi:asparagine synthase (glutamine-hydrolysing)
MYLDYFEPILFQLEEISEIHLGPWLVYKTQRENGVVVTIDGHGSDEALGGYPWYVTAAFKDAVRKLSPSQAYEFVKIMRGLELFPEDQFYLRSIQSLFSKLTATSRQPWLSSPGADFRSPGFAADLPRLAGRDALFKRLYIDFHFTQLPSVLRNFDRLSMAHGVEVRSPFLDWRLICFLFSIPSSSKIGSGFTKRILRDALVGILPEPIRTRTQKLGFPNLTEALTSERIQSFIRDTVHSTEFQHSSIWNGKRIADDLGMALRNSNMQQIQRAWIYVQAMSLMHLFQKKRQTYFG